MDDIGSFVYFIILAIIFIVNAIFSAQKKKLKREQEERRREGPVDSEDPPPPSRPDREKSFEEVLDEVFGEGKNKTSGRPERTSDRPPDTQNRRPPTQSYQRERQKPKKEKVLPPVKNAPKNKYQEYMEAHPELVKRTEKRHVSPNKDQLEIIDLESGPAAKRGRFEVNLRDAIIYQAILEPKYDDI